MGSVYGELKLSEKLAAELQSVREQVDHLRESLEEALYLKEKNKSDLEQVKIESAEKDKIIQAQKKEIILIKQQSKQATIESIQMMRSSKALTDFVSTSELYRKKFSEQLRKALSKNDELTNQIFELGQNKKLTQISYENVQDKLNQLYKSVNAISNAKNLEDKFQFEIDAQKKLIEDLKKEKEECELSCR